MSGHSYLQTVLTSGCSKKMHLPGSQILFASVLQLMLFMILMKCHLTVVIV